MRRLGRTNWGKRLKIQWDMLSGNPSQSISGAPTQHSCWKNNIPIWKRGPDKWRSTKKWGWKLKIPPPPKSHKKNQTTCLPISSSSPTSKTNPPQPLNPQGESITKRGDSGMKHPNTSSRRPARPGNTIPEAPRDGTVSHPGMTHDIFRFREIPHRESRHLWRLHPGWGVDPMLTYKSPPPPKKKEVWTATQKTLK